MKSKGLIKRVGLGIIASLLCFGFSRAAEATKTQPDASIGKKLFEGSIQFVNNGPACISCHNVKNDNLISGGLFAKDLTDVYTRMGEGLGAWLGAPPFPAMATAYQNNALTESERAHLTAFFKEANDVKSKQHANSGYSFMFMGGISGFVILLILISLIWFKRKRKMVKQDIFDRQSKAWDAKF